jgi:hypothetical protein
MILVRAVFQAKVGKAQELVARFKAAMQQSDLLIHRNAPVAPTGN